MPRIKIGDIFEIKTPKGKAYLHFVYKDKLMGDLIRVLPGLFNERPNNICELVKSRERYMIFFPLAAAYHRKIIEYVNHLDLKDFVKPQYMRDKHVVRGNFLGWHLVDTNTMHRQMVEILTSKQKELSPWGIWNDTLLIERLTENWTLEAW